MPASMRESAERGWRNLPLRYKGAAVIAIPIAARILAVADSYDALRCRRIYKPAYNHDHACDVILNGDGRTLPAHFDPAVLQAFRDLHVQFEATHARFYA